MVSNLQAIHNQMHTKEMVFPVELFIDATKVSMPQKYQLMPQEYNLMPWDKPTVTLQYIIVYVPEHIVSAFHFIQFD